MIDLLTIIYAPTEGKLLPFRNKATHWLPENSDENSDIYKPQNVVCTTKCSVLEMLRILIIEGIIPFDRAVWIDATKPRDIIAFTFNAIGKTNNFFKV